MGLDFLCNLKTNIHDDPNNNYNIFEDKLTKAIQKHTIEKQIKFNKFKHKKNPWMSEGLLKSIRFRDKMHLKLKSQGQTAEQYADLKTNIKTYNRIIKRLIRKLKRQYMTTRFEQCKSNIKKTWNILNEVLGRAKRDTTSESFIIDQHKISDPKLIANHFNNFFINIGNSDTHTDNDGFNKYLGHEQSHNFKFDTITNNETIRIITNIKSKHSCGHDSISTALLKQIKTEVSPSITLIINQCLTTGIFPNKLKIAKVVPVFKKGDNELLNNYRPISVLPSISKIFETVIYNQLYDYLQEHHVITNSQYGFRKKHSTEYTAIELVDRIMEKLDRNKVPFNIYIDLSKAFDMIDHNILLFKLHHYGIRNGALNLLKNYFTGRKQYCHFKNNDSSLLNIHKGVPQGSILGPLLFILYINDFIYSSDRFEFLMYADDTTLFSTYDKFENIDDKTIETIQTNINKELFLIVSWLHCNKLLINTTKTKMTIFHTPHREVIYPKIKINNTSVEIVGEFKFLGIFIDKHLKWSTHIEFIANKISKYIGVINRLKHTLPPRILLTLYNTLILPHLNYGLVLWGPGADWTVGKSVIYRIKFTKKKKKK